MILLWYYYYIDVLWLNKIVYQEYGNEIIYIIESCCADLAKNWLIFSGAKPFKKGQVSNPLFSRPMAIVKKTASGSISEMVKPLLMEFHGTKFELSMELKNNFDPWNSFF